MIAIRNSLGKGENDDKNDEKKAKLSRCERMLMEGEEFFRKFKMDLLGILKPIEADIIRKRFGLIDGKSRTLKEIGDSYQLSAERIRQLQFRGMAKIRKRSKGA